MARSVSTDTSVEPPASAIETVTFAPAVPLPRLSLPLASTTKRWASASFSTNVPLPLYSSAIGPSLTFTDPENDSSSASVTWAPGKHSATEAMSLKCAQVSSTPIGTVKRWLSSIYAPAALSTARPVSTRARCWR